MDIICDIVMMILAADLTGTILALVWLAMFRYFDKYLRADIINFTLKCVIISFYIPSMVIILVLKSYLFGGTENYYSNYTNYMRVLSFLILTVFIYKLVRKLIKWYKESKKINEVILFKAKVEDKNILGVVNEVKKNLKIRRKFKVYMSTGIATPFIYGFFIPKIYIKVEKFDRENLKMILTHEMYHYKQKDPIMKPIAGIMCCMHWFNPLPKKIKDYYATFAEVGCDYKCIKKAGYSAEDYFGNIAKSSKKAVVDLISLISMAGDEESALEREKLANKYTLSKKKGWILTLVLTVSIAISSTAIYAATDITESVYNLIFTSSSEQIKETMIVCDDGFTEYIEEKDKYTFEKTKSYFEINCNNGYTNKLIIGENTDFKVRIVFFKLINVDEGDKISITVNEDDNDSKNKELTLELGIIEPDGIIRYIEGENIINHTFEITKPGDYQVYILNGTEKSIKLNTSIIYYPREEE